MKPEALSHFWDAVYLPTSDRCQRNRHGPLSGSAALNAAKHKTMKAKGADEHSGSKLWITAPAYPFTARDVLGDLRFKLGIELRQPMSYRRLGRMIGRSKSSTHRWFTQSEQPEVISFLSMLERLSPTRRHAFVEAHCRVNPTFAHRRLSHAPGKIRVLSDLLEQRAGITLIGGDVESTRLFVVTAMAHAHYGMSGQGRCLAGVDVHRPINFVPVEGLLYIDGTLEPKRLRRLIAGQLPRILVSAASLLVFNGVWNFVPEMRHDILRCAGHKHVILAEAGIPDMVLVKKWVRTPIHVVTLSASKLVREGIRVVYRRATRQKAQ